MNGFKTFVLMFALLLLFMAVGQGLGGRQGMIMFFILGAAMNFGAYWFSDRIVLAMYRAREAKTGEYPALRSLVERLAREAGMPMPRVYLMDQPAPNAFATGRSPAHSAVCVTTGILGVMTEAELCGVLAHELAHVKNRDILLATVASVIASAISMAGSMMRWGMMTGAGRGRDDDDSGGGLGVIFAAIVAPLAAMLLQLAISRSREYEADQTGGRITGRPGDLASALGKLEVYSKKVPLAHLSESTSHLFIVKPFSGNKMLSLFSTHPPVAERIKRLEQLALKIEAEKYKFPEVIS